MDAYGGVWMRVVSNRLANVPDVDLIIAVLCSNPKFKSQPTKLNMVQKFD